MKYKIKNNFIFDSEQNSTIPMDERNQDYQQYLQWVKEGNTPDPEDPLTPEEIAAAAEAIRSNQERLEILADNKFQAFITKTPTQVKSWTKNSFPSLTLAEQNDLITIVQAICILGRRL